MQKRSLALVALVLATSITLTLVLWRPSSDVIVLGSPPWADSDSHEDDGVTLKPVAAEVGEVPYERQPVKEESGLKEMVPLKTLASSLQESKQEVTFNASVLVDAGMAQGVADAIMEAAEQHWALYQHMRLSEKADNGLRKSADYFFATWPDLPMLIREKLVRLDIHPVTDNSVTATSLTYAYVARKKELAALIRTPRWKVNITYTEGSGPADLFEAIEASRKPQR